MLGFFSMFIESYMKIDSFFFSFSQWGILKTHPIRLSPDRLLSNSHLKEMTWDSMSDTSTVMNHQNTFSQGDAMSGTFYCFFVFLFSSDCL